MNRISEFREAVSKTKYPCWITMFSDQELESFDLILSEDKKSGCAITPDGELVSLFNYGDKGRGRQLVILAIMSGANHLYCFDGFLTDYYGSLGFVEYDRIPFDDSLAPDDWDYEAIGRPDVVYMRLRSTGDLRASKGILANLPNDIGWFK